MVFKNPYGKVNGGAACLPAKFIFLPKIILKSIQPTHNRICLMSLLNFLYKKKILGKEKAHKILSE
jgi:hypothetical protein